MKLHRELTDLLAKIGPPGAFATRTTAAPEALRLEVRGVGPVRLPVTRARGRRLCGIARPARYGLGDRTLLDPGVRDTWEIARSRVKIDQRKWKQTLLPELERIRRGLGLPEECRLSAELHNMLVYEPGQFFLPHQDTEKQDGMIGSLVVLLPSDHKGGSMVQHHDEKVSFRGSREKLTLIAFYADCRHEVRPVKEGYRVVLTFNLRAERGTAGVSSSPAADVIEPLTRAVGEYFETPPSHLVERPAVPRFRLPPRPSEHPAGTRLAASQERGRRPRRGVAGGCPAARLRDFPGPGGGA